MKLFAVKLLKTSLASLLLVSMAYAMPLASSARACVPADLLQLISVDYRAIKDSPTAMALKQQIVKNVQSAPQDAGRLVQNWMQGS